MTDEAVEVMRSWLSWPTVGKHVAFDGRLLHAAPVELTRRPAPDSRARSAEQTREGAATVPGGGKKGTQSKNSKAARKARAREREREKAGLRGRRITLVVNVWLGHTPWNTHAFPSSELGRMKAGVSGRAAARVVVGEREDGGGGGGESDECPTTLGLVEVHVDAGAGDTRLVELAGPDPRDPKVALRLPKEHLEPSDGPQTLALSFGRGAELRLPLR